MPDSSGTTHIWTKCTGSRWDCSPVRVHESFFSECRMPRQAGVYHAGVPSGVLVYQRATQHPSHDLHVAVGMGLESSAWRDYVVVVHQQQAVMGVIGLIMAAERERVLGVQPRDLRLRAIVGTPDLDSRCVHVFTSRLASLCGRH